MSNRRRRVNLAIEVLVFVLAVGAVDLAFFRSDLSTGASILLFSAEVFAGAIAWIAASRLLEGRIRWGFEAAPNGRRRALATVIGVCVFFVLLAATSLAFGWRSMSLVPIVAITFLVWWLLAELLPSHDEIRRI